uniref:Steroid 5-alpha reductase C-terminal domain-containing protein n=1 Tax=Romanomermis culicivorax TaxID=13658 RepID=A0A915JJX0_ROMCU
MPFVMHLSCLCYTSHFAKRLFETLFVHRFSHATMPLRNVFKNCGYYWLFAAFIAYFNNHPLYTVASFGNVQIGLGLFGFIFCQFGNLSVHLAFMKMRPAGTKQRKVPMPNANPFTKLFSLVSCPNYTYEVGAWLSYSIMTQSLPALLFTIAGFYQMTIWAIGKHKNYRKEFPNYPKNRKSIIPFVI